MVEIVVDEEDGYARELSELSPKELRRRLSQDPYYRGEVEGQEREGLEDAAKLMQMAHAGEYQRLNHGLNPIRRLRAQGHRMLSGGSHDINPRTYHNKRLH